MASQPVTRPALLVQADSLLHLAENWCRRGLHAQAADALLRAAGVYEAGGDWYMAAHCHGQAEAELVQRRWTPPVNVSALVD